MRVRSLAAALVPLLIAAQLTACGTILYPERRDQDPGRVDADIVILDAVGLLFFLVPGVIAFAVDFATGAIYLPPGERSRVSEILGAADIEERKLEGRDARAIERAVREAVGIEIDLAERTVQVLPGREGEDVRARVARLQVATLAAEPRPGISSAWR